MVHYHQNLLKGAKISNLTHAACEGAPWKEHYTAEKSEMEEDTMTKPALGNYMCNTVKWDVLVDKEVLILNMPVNTTDREQCIHTQSKSVILLRLFQLQLMSLPH